MATIGQVRQQLDELRSLDRGLRVFGAEHHRYRLTPPLTENEVAWIEQTCGIRLPEDYRAFLTEVGDGSNRAMDVGGAGPGYGLFSVQTAEARRAVLSQPFPLSHSVLGVVELKKDDPYWSDAYAQNKNGNFPLAHYGCDIYAKLVVTGAAAGTVWVIDHAVGDMAHYADYSRYHLAVGGRTLNGGTSVGRGPHSFLDWYEDWLDANLEWGRAGFPERGEGEEVPTDLAYLPGARIIEPEQEPTAVPSCPSCGQRLRTPTARQCFACGADWHKG
jgi:hypothetical protein